MCSVLLTVILHVLHVPSSGFVGDKGGFIFIMKIVQKAQQTREYKWI